MKRFAEIVVSNRVMILVAMALVTLVFLYQGTQLTFRTNFDDLLPQKHPFIQVHNKVRDIFGGANQIIIMVQVRQGDIFNQDTLSRVQWIHNELQRIPGADPYKIRSIACSKMKDFQFSSGTMSITPLMFPDIPADDQEMQELMDKVYSNPRYYGQYVSYDSMKTLLMVDFFEGEELNYREIFRLFSEIRETIEDDNHILSIAGEPMHMGYIYHHSKHVLLLILASLCAIALMLFLYYRSIRAVVIPLLAIVMSAIWGIGIMSLLNYNLDPLILVLPFLLSLMTLPHCLQNISRFLEEYAKHRHTRQAAINTIENMFMPGVTGVVTDALGIALVGIATIPVLVNISVVSVFWCIVTIIVLSLIMTPLLLSFIPETERVKKLFDTQWERHSRDYRVRILSAVGNWIPRRGKWYVLVCAVVIVGVGMNYARQLRVGDFLPGSSILWPFHRYNLDAFRITFSIPLLNPLYVIVEGDEGGFITSGPTLREMNEFQRHMAKHDRVMFTYSIVNALPGFLMSSYEDDPQWNHLPKEDRVLSFIARRLTYAGEPGTWDRYVDMEDRYANIIIYCRDKMPRTVESIMAHINEYLEETPGPPGGRYLLAGGAVGVQAAVRDVIADSQIWNLVYALTGIFLFCSLYFRSFFAGLILVIPLMISNIITFALMGAYHIGLTVNTYPVSSIGIGLGVDYGIYLMSRCTEETKRGTNLFDAIKTALLTNGRAIFQIATTITVGLLLWVFSPLKFHAEMGVLLAILLLLNMLGAILFIPTLLCLFKPKFIAKKG